MTRPGDAYGANRRSFLISLALAGVGALVRPADLFGAGWSAAGGRRTEPALRIAHLVRVEPGVAIPARQGAELGAAEAQQAAALLGLRMSLESEGVDGAASSSAAVRRYAAAGVRVVIGHLDEEASAAAAAAASQLGIIYLNAADPADELRDACVGGTFHVAASAAMRRDALALARLAPAGAGERLEAVVWHPTLERYGAGQVNDRYRVRFGGGMNGDAWTGWMAVKIAWEAFARTRGGDAEAMAAYLLSPRARFDGHKGIELTFRASDRQLRQPLYVVRSSDGPEEAVLEEVPRPGAAAERDPAEVLDALGGGMGGCDG